MRKTIVTSEVIVLGRQGEDQANKVLFPVRGWKELYGDGQFVVTALRPDENDPYPVTTHIYEEDDDSSVTRCGVFVEWIVGAADVEIPGRGKVELAYYTSDDVRVKSVVYHTVIYDALGQNSLTPPEPWESWVDDVREAGADAIQAAEDAAASAEGASQAADDASDSADDARQAAEEAAGAVSTAFSQITATATTLSPGSPATASFNPSTKVMSFGIPRGQDGSGSGDGEVKVLVATEEDTSIGFSAEDADYLFNHDNYDPAHSAGFVKPTVIYVPSYIFNANEYALVFVVTSASYANNGNLTLGAEAVLYDGTTRFFHMALYGQRLSGLSGDSVSGGITEITLLSADDITTVIDTMHTMTDAWIPSAKAVKTKLAEKENVGKIKISNTQYSVQRKALTITENGVTITYYVADITNT